MDRQIKIMSGEVLGISERVVDALSIRSLHFDLSGFQD